MFNTSFELLQSIVSLEPQIIGCGRMQMLEFILDLDAKIEKHSIKPNTLLVTSVPVIIKLKPFERSTGFNTS